MKSLIQQINEHLEMTFKDNQKRLKHIYAVRDKAIKLGLIYQVDLDSLEVAALLHDATKNDAEDQILLMIKDAFIGEDLKDIPAGCLHAYSATILAKKTFKITNQDILNAITYHCSGRPNMSKIEQIIYVSDYIEESRTFVDDELREMAEKDLDLATFTIIKSTVEYLENHHRNVSKLTHEAFRFYQNKIGGI